MQSKRGKIDLSANSSLQQNYAKVSLWLQQQFSNKKLELIYNNGKALAKIDKILSPYVKEKNYFLGQEIKKNTSSSNLINQLAVNAINNDYTNICLILAGILDQKTQTYILTNSLRKNKLELITELAGQLPHIIINKVFNEITEIDCNREAIYTLAKFTDDKYIIKVFETAIRRHKYEIVQALANLVPKSTVTDALEYSTYNNNNMMINILLKSKNICEQTKINLFTLALEGLQDSTISLLAANLDTSTIELALLKANFTSLSAESITAIAIATGFSWQAKTSKHTYRNISLFSYAVLTNNTVFIKALAKNRLELNKADQYNHTPLHYSIIKQDIKIAEFLISNGAKVNLSGRTPNRTSRLPIHIAAELNSKALLNLLLENKADINANEHPTGFTALHYAVCAHNFSLVKFLCEQGADINNHGRSSKNCCGSPLVFAPMSEDDFKTQVRASLIDSSKINKILDYLLSNGAKVNDFEERFEIYQGSYSALHASIDKQDLYSFRRLLARGAKVHSPYHYKQTPLDKIKQNPALVKEYNSIVNKNPHLNLSEI